MTATKAAWHALRPVTSRIDVAAEAQRKIGDSFLTRAYVAASNEVWSQISTVSAMTTHGVVRSACGDPAPAEWADFVRRVSA